MVAQPPFIVGVPEQSLGAPTTFVEFKLDINSGFIEWNPSTQQPGTFSEEFDLGDRKNTIILNSCVLEGLDITADGSQIANLELSLILNGQQIAKTTKFIEIPSTGPPVEDGYSFAETIVFNNTVAFTNQDTLSVSAKVVGADDKVVNAVFHVHVFGSRRVN